MTSVLLFLLRSYSLGIFTKVLALLLGLHQYFTKNSVPIETIAIYIE